MDHRIAGKRVQNPTDSALWFIVRIFIVENNIMIIEIKCTANVMCFNHSESPLFTWFTEEWPATKVVRSAKKVGTANL